MQLQRMQNQLQNLVVVAWVNLFEVLKGLSRVLHQNCGLAQPSKKAKLPARKRKRLMNASSRKSLIKALPRETRLVISLYRAQCPYVTWNYGHVLRALLSREWCKMHLVFYTRVSTRHVPKSPMECSFWHLEDKGVTAKIGL